MTSIRWIFPSTPHPDFSLSSWSQLAHIPNSRSEEDLAHIPEISLFAWWKWMAQKADHEVSLVLIAPLSGCRSTNVLPTKCNAIKLRSASIPAWQHMADTAASKLMLGLEDPD